jgi:hypothetical protein
LIALKFSQKVLNFRKIYTPKFLGCYIAHPVFLWICRPYIPIRDAPHAAAVDSKASTPPPWTPVDVVGAPYSRPEDPSFAVLRSPALQLAASSSTTIAAQGSLPSVCRLAWALSAPFLFSHRLRLPTQCHAQPPRPQHHPRLPRPRRHHPWTPPTVGRAHCYPCSPPPAPLPWCIPLLPILLRTLCPQAASVHSN